MEEIWKEIEGYEDYHVSTYGRVKSYKRYKDGKLLKPRSDKFGYCSIVLFDNTKRKKCLVHRLVAFTFVNNKNEEEFFQVNHIDEDKSNNHVNNLEWCNAQYNIEYSKARNHKIIFPDGHEEIIFNLAKFCRDNNLSQGTMNLTFMNGSFHKGFKVLERIDQDGNITKAKIRELKKMTFKILFLDGHEEIIFNLTKFCRDHTLNISCLQQGFKTGNLHRGFKILEKTSKDEIITKAKK